ncbi:MAG: NUDIX hydrolase [Acidobacteria bacterium]|nr:NUDIX hydrolase [Acidobacteriota bacterium]
MRREYPDAPRVGVAAAVIRGEEVLLLRRGQEPLKGHWSLPGGLLEVGETLRDGVCREVLEETGLTIEPLEMLEVAERIAHDEKGLVRFHYVLVEFLCHETGGHLQAATDADEVRWTTRSELISNNIYNCEPALMAVIEKGFKQDRNRS